MTLENIECIKYLILDMDGTLLDKRQRISDENINYLRKCEKASVALVIASGRPFRLVVGYLNKIGIGSNMYIICRDGMQIYNSLGVILHEERMLSGYDLKNILQYLPSKRVEAYTAQMDYIYIPSFIKRLKFKSRKRGCRSVLINRSDDSIEKIEKIEKIKVFSPSINENLLDELRSLYNICKMGNSIYEINTYGVNKLSALKWLDKEKLIDLDKSLYIGDDYNDIDCFEYLKYCVAMGNAVIDLRDKALFVTKTNEESGVAFVIKKILGENRE